MRGKFPFFIFLVIAFGKIPVQGATVIDYFVKIPSKGNCQSDAENLGRHLHTLTGAEIKIAECLGQVPVSVKSPIQEILFSSLHVAYQITSENFNKQIKTFYLGISSLAGSKNNYIGPYKTIQSCLADLNVRTIEFERFSAPTIASTCERATQEDAASYVARFDTAGAPTATLQTVEDLSDRLTAKDSQWAMEKILRETQAQVILHQAGHYYVYAQTPLSPTSQVFAKSTLRQCEDQISTLSSLLKDFEGHGLSIGCLKSYFGSQSSSFLIGVWNHQPLTYDFYEPAIYGSYEECRSDIDGALLKRWREGMFTGAAFCSFTETSSLHSRPQEFHLHLIEAPSINRL